MIRKAKSPKAYKLKRKSRTSPVQKEKEPTEVISIEKSFTPEAVRAEVNLLVFPFFSLSRQDTYTKTMVGYQATATRDNKKLEITWKVTANPEYGHPGPFDRKLYKAVEQILSEQKPPFFNPIALGSVRHLAKRMGISQWGGDINKEIKVALKRIVATTVESVGTFYSKAKKKYIEDIFHLYDRVIFTGEELPDGEIADTNYLFLNSWILENLNARYVRPLDYSYFKSLKSNIASRLYELLGVKFYGLENSLYVRYKYSTICQLLPVIYQKYFSNAKRIFDPAHQELIQTKFLSKVEWSPLSGDKQDWYITYYRGERAEKEIRKFQPQVEPLVESDASLKELTCPPDAELSLTNSA